MVKVSSAETDSVTAGVPPVANGAPDIAGNKASGRVLLVLSQFGGGAESYGVAELSRILGMTKNMVHRALTTLLRRGYLIRDETGSRYQLGPGVLGLGGAGLPDLDLVPLCQPAMRAIRDLTNETVTLAVPNGRTAVTIAGVRGRGSLARSVPLGRVIPLHVSPAARAILANLPDDAIDRYLEQPLERFTAATLVTPEAVWAEVRAVRARGHATVLNDHWLGTRGVAFPVRAAGDVPHGSITVGGPASRITEDKLHQVLPGIEAVMAELNELSGLYVAVSTNGSV